MNKKTIVYYHPRSIRENSDRGSDVRVKNMLDAFRTMNYDVIVIAGDARARHAKIKELKSSVRSGLTIEYVYGESTNAPVMLADKKLMPSNCLVDYLFLYWLSNSGIPVGIFYRDIHWRFGYLKQQLPWPLSILLKPLYYLDCYVYNRFSDVLFLPSAAMNHHLPRPRAENSIEALPPGFEASTEPRPPYDINSTKPLELLYVGGLEPTVYDISRLLEIVTGRTDVKLTLCCRSSEWEQYQSLYNHYLADNIELVHVNSSELSTYYHRADVFLMVMRHTQYMDFAVPVKFFETIGYCVPVITMNYTEVANRIQSMDVGWVLTELDELNELLNQLCSNRSMLAEKYDNLLPYREQCSWDSRAIAVDNRLLPQQTQTQTQTISETDLHKGTKLND